MKPRKHKPLLRLLRIVVTIIAAVIALWWTGGFFMQRWILYPAPHRTVTAPDYVQRFTIDTDAGPVDAMFMAPPGPSDLSPTASHNAQRYPLIVFAHGNGDQIDFYPAALHRYCDMGFAVLLVEYRGYGKSAGSPSQQAITDDFVQALDQIIAQQPIDPARIIYHGYSLGGGVVCSLARIRPPAAIILQSPFTSISSMAWRMGFPSFLVRDKYDNIGFLRTYDRPVLIMHGRTDPIIPFALGRELADACPHATFVPLDCSHNDVPLNTDAYWRHITDFLDQRDPPPGGRT